MKGLYSCSAVKIDTMTSKLYPGGLVTWLSMQCAFQGGNIGVTPFISILRKLLTDMERNKCSNCGEVTHSPTKYQSTEH